MAHILDFDRVLNFHGRAARAGKAEPAEYWPGVSCGPCAAPDPANAPQRVLAEMALILAGCGVLVTLSTVLAHLPPLS